MTDKKRIPKRPVNKYDGVTYITTDYDICDHDLPVVHMRKRGKWVPYVSNLFYYIIILTFIVGLFT
jgi:hypothetical protein